MPELSLGATCFAARVVLDERRQRYTERIIGAIWPACEVRGDEAQAITGRIDSTVGLWRARCKHAPMSELTMTKPQREAFLADLHVGVITVAREGAAPLAAPVWYSYAPGGDVIFDFASASEKIKLLELAGRASLCVQNEVMPYRYVTVEGPTVVGSVNDEVERSLAHRYLGAEIGGMYLDSIAGTVSRVVRLTPTRWRTSDYSALVARVMGAASS